MHVTEAICYCVGLSALTSIMLSLGVINLDVSKAKPSFLKISVYQIVHSLVCVVDRFSKSKPSLS